MAIKRSEQIDPENAGYYHLISRCVRHAMKFKAITKDKELLATYRSHQVKKYLLSI